MKSLKREGDVPDVPIIIIAQRLHTDDLCAHIEQYERNDYKVIKVKALNDDDTSFWEASKPAKDLIKLRDSVHSLETFYAQYQQEPINLGGQVIKAEWFQDYYLKDLNNLNFYKTFIVADTAQKTGKANDYSVFMVCGLTKIEGQKRLYILDGIRGKWGAVDLLEKAKFIYSKWRNRFSNRRCSGIYIEDKSSGIGLLQQLRKVQKIPVLPLKPGDKDKLTRVEDILYYVATGFVYLPVDLPFTNDLKTECTLFSRDGKHKHDDIVDTLTYACNIVFGSGGCTIFDIM